MEIHQLRYFIAVAEEGSFSRAAAREHVAQPSLSQQIQKLEADMDQRLFDRLSRTVVVTEAGKCLLEYARKILVEIAEARRCLDDLKRDVAGPTDHWRDSNHGALCFAETDQEIQKSLSESRAGNPGGHNRKPRFTTGGRNPRHRYYVDLPAKPGLGASSLGQGGASCL